MKNSEEVIDRVLAGLRDVEIPAGLERRVAEGLEERSAARAVSAKGWLGSLSMRGGMRIGFAACGFALAGILVVVLVVPAIRRVGHASVGSKAEVAPVVQGPVAFSGTSALGSEAALRGRGVRGMKERGGSSIADSVADSAVDSEDSLAMSEMRAASFPAPPMPLTEQERLFLRMTRRGDAVELAVLDPHLRELEEREEKAEFQRFFAKPALATAGERSLPEQPLPGQPTESSTPQAAAEQATPEPAAPQQPLPDVEMPKQTSPDSLGMKQSAPQELITKAQQTSVDTR